MHLYRESGFESFLNVKKQQKKLKFKDNLIKFRQFLLIFRE